MAKYIKSDESPEELAASLGMSLRVFYKTEQKALEKIRQKLIEWGMYDELESAFADIYQRDDESWNRYFTKSSPYCR